MAKEKGTPKFKTMKEECEYYEAQARGPISPDAEIYIPKPGAKRVTIEVLPLTFQEIDELGRIATELNIPFDTLVQRSLRETIRRYRSPATAKKLPAKRAPAKKLTTSTKSTRPKTPAAA